MKFTKILAVTALAVQIALPSLLGAADAKGDNKTGKAKPYPLKTCIVSDEKLGEMGDPYVFTHEGQEVKLCCKSCLKDFKKDSAKYMKKLNPTDKKSKSS